MTERRPRSFFRPSQRTAPCAAHRSPAAPTASPAPRGHAGTPHASTLSKRDSRARPADPVTQRLAELEREKAIEKAKAAPRVTAGREGFLHRPTAFTLRLRGYPQSDARFYSRRPRNRGADTFLLRRVRPLLEGTIFRFVDFRLMPDFGSGTTVLQDAYVDLKFAPRFKVRAGKFKGPVGLERLQSALDIPFVERALPTVDRAEPRRRRAGLRRPPRRRRSTTPSASSTASPTAQRSISTTGTARTSWAASSCCRSNEQNDRLAKLGLGIAATAGRSGARCSRRTCRSSGRPASRPSHAIASTARRPARRSPTATTGGFHRRATTTPGRSVCWRIHLLFAAGAPRPLDGALGTRAWQLTTSYVLTGEAARIAGCRLAAPSIRRPGHGAPSSSTRAFTSSARRGRLPALRQSRDAVREARAWGRRGELVPESGSQDQGSSKKHTTRAVPPPEIVTPTTTS